MKIYKYFITLKSRVDLFNKLLQDPLYKKDLNNPFNSTFPKTYVWVEKSDKKY